MKLVPFLAVVALAASVECMSLFSPYDDLSSELMSDSSEISFDSSEEDVLSTPRFSGDSFFRPATLRAPRVGLRRVIMVSFEPSPADRFASDEEMNMFSPPARSASPWAMPRKLIRTYPSEEAMFPSFPKVAEDRFDWPESDEEVDASQPTRLMKPKKFWEQADSSLLVNAPAPLPKVPRKAPLERLDWPEEVATPRKPSIMRPVLHVSTPSPFERSLMDLAKEFKKAEQQEALEQELDALKYKHHPNVVQI